MTIQDVTPILNVSSHGLDDEGRQFDAHCNLRDWWTESKAFTGRA